MWFKNALIYDIHDDVSFDLLEEQLRENALTPCPPHTPINYGWVEVLPDAFSHSISKVYSLSLGQEERLLPKGVVNQLLNERVRKLEIQEDRKVSRKERQSIQEDIIFELLPKAFCHQKKTSGIIDTVQKKLIIHTSNKTQGDHFTANLKKVMNNCGLTSWIKEKDYRPFFMDWLLHPENCPSVLTLGNYGLFVSEDDTKKKITFKNHEVSHDEIQHLFEQGYRPEALSFIWQERCQFILTKDAMIKSIQPLDYLIDELKETRQEDDAVAEADAALTLLSLELRAIIADLERIEAGYAVAPSEKELEEAVV